MFEKVIFHIDVNSAYLSWEAAYRIYHKGAVRDLREVASAVGGDSSLRRGIILAKSIPAKKYGIKTGESIPEALQKCPGLILVQPNYTIYDKASKALMKLLRGYSDQVEQYSIDEAFVDMTQSVLIFGGILETAEEIRRKIKEELGFTVNIGISGNKLLAKMASDFKKPDRVHTLFREEIQRKMWPLPVSDLFFVGRATAAKLFSLGIRTVGELAQADPILLRQHLKKQGEVIWAFANGVDLSEVQSVSPPNKGYGNSTTIAFDVTEEAQARLVLLALAETLAARLRADEKKAQVLAVGIKDSSFVYSSHQKVLQNATNITAEIYRYAAALFCEAWDGRAVRQLGIHAGRIQDGDAARQLALFEEDYEKLSEADQMVDLIREKYGIDAVKRAVFLSGRMGVDHMAGGISREKWKADYTQMEGVGNGIWNRN